MGREYVKKDTCTRVHHSLQDGVIYLQHALCKVKTHTLHSLGLVSTVMHRYDTVSEIKKTCVKRHKNIVEISAKYLCQDTCHDLCTVLSIPVHTECKKVDMCPEYTYADDRNILIGFLFRFR